jgi:hypothetical protein
VGHEARGRGGAVLFAAGEVKGKSARLFWEPLVFP